MLELSAILFMIDVKKELLEKHLFLLRNLLLFFKKIFRKFFSLKGKFFLLKDEVVFVKNFKRVLGQNF